MTVMQNMPDSKYTTICKLLDIVLIVLYLAFFLLSFFPYSVRSAGDTVDIRGVSVTLESDDSYSLFSFTSFPENHPWFETYKVTGYKSEILSHKIVNIKDVGPALCLNIFALIFIIMLVVKNGNGRTLFGIFWGLCGIWSFLANRFLLTGNTWVRPVLFAVVIIAFAVNLADFLLKHSDNARKAKYLRTISAVYK